MTLPPSSLTQNLNTSNDFSLLPELHAASAGLKSYCTSMAAAGVETCRRVREDLRVGPGDAATASF